MQISEGVLSAPVLVTGAALSAGGCAIGVKKLDYDRVPHDSSRPLHTGFIAQMWLCRLGHYLHHL